MPQTTNAAELDRVAIAAHEAERISGRLIVCIASAWDIDPTSKHHVMRALSKRNDIIWVNYHASRRPRFNTADLRSVCRVLQQAVRGPREIDKRMVQVTPLVLPGRAAPFRDIINQRLLLMQIQRTIRARRRHPHQPVQIWTFAPDVAFLAGVFDEECLVYYCVDEFSEFAGYDRAATLAAENALLARADVVLATSEQLFTARRDRHPRVHLVRHGVDHAHFSRAVTRELPLPAALANIPHPIAGFFGLVQNWFDVELMAAVAGHLPGVSFVIVGQCDVDVAPLSRLPNVHLLGRQQYADLPNYCAAFDVGLIPFVRSRLTDSVNPIKLREYLAAGLPVVATDLPEVRRYAPEVACADHPADFAAACEGAIAQDSGAARQARSAKVRDESWESVTAHIERLVSGATRINRIV